MNPLPFPLLSLAVLAPAAGALAVWRTRSVRLARLLAILAVTISLLASIAVLSQVIAHGSPVSDPWALPLLGEAQPLFATAMLSAIWLVLFAALALFTITIAPRRDLDRPRLAQKLLLVTAVSTVYASNHLLLLVAGWALAALPMMAFGNRRESGSYPPRAAWLLRMVLLAGVVSLAAAVFLLGRDAAAAGLPSPYSLHLLRGASLPSGHWAFAFLMMAVLFTKGIFPFHSWVLTAFDRGSLLTANLFVNAHLGAFLIAKVAIPVLPATALTALPLLSDVALFTMCYMAVLALRERSPRRILALLFVGQASTILVGLESATEAGVTGALVHRIVVAVSTTVLAAVLRLLETRTGSRLESAHFLGLANRFPRLAVFFLIGGLALIGLPGTLGFCAEDLLIHGTLESHPQLGIALPIATALFACHLLRLFSMLFLGRKSSDLAILPDAVPRERLCLAALVAFLVLFGIAPAWIVDRQSSAAIPLVHQLREASLRPPPALQPIV